MDSNPRSMAAMSSTCASFLVQSANALAQQMIPKTLTRGSSIADEETPDGDAESAAAVRRMEADVLDACRETAKSFRGSVADRSNRTMILSLLRAGPDKVLLHNRLLQTIAADPELARCRFDSAGTGVPDGFTPLHMAASIGNLPVLRMLLQCKDDADPAVPVVQTWAVDLQGRTALHVAVANGKVEAAQLLREAMKAQGRPRRGPGGASTGPEGAPLVDHVDPVGADAPIDLCGCTPLGWAGKHTQLFLPKFEDVLEENSAAAAGAAGAGVGQETLPETPVKGGTAAVAAPPPAPSSPPRPTGTSASNAPSTPASATPIKTSNSPSPASPAQRRIPSANSLLRLGDKTLLPQSPLKNRAGNRSSNQNSPVASSAAATFAATLGLSKPPAAASLSRKTTPVKSSSASSTPPPLHSSSPSTGNRPPPSPHSQASGVLYFGHSEATGWRPYMEDRVIVPQAAAGGGGGADTGSLLHLGATGRGIGESSLVDSLAKCSLSTLGEQARSQLSRTFLFGVCDGHGGDYTVNYLQRNLPLFVKAEVMEALQQYPGTALTAAGASKAMTSAFLRADQALSLKGRMKPQVNSKGVSSYLDKSGSTGVLVLLTDDWLCVAHVGDSRAVIVSPVQPDAPYMCSSCGRVDERAAPSPAPSTAPTAVDLVIRHATTDHKTTTEAEKARIRAAGADVNEETGEVFLPSAGAESTRLRMSRAVGDFFFKQNADLPQEQQAVSPLPDVAVLPRSESEDGFVILACDGVWDVMSNEEAALFVYERLRARTATATATSIDPSVLPAVADELIHHCVETLGAVDNMSVVLLLLNSPQKLGFVASK